MTVRSFLAVPVILALAVLLPLGNAQADNGIEHLDKPDAVITTSESIDDHEGAYEDIHNHEGRTEDIHNHEGRAGDIHNHEEAAEDIHDHHADSETLDGRVVESERLSGMGKLPETSTDRLKDARAKLQAARARHAHHQARAAKEQGLNYDEGRAPAPAAADPEAPASSAAAGDRWAHWTARIDMVKHRVAVADAVVGVWDESYAKMIQADYPRGDARQKLIDSRNQAKQRLVSEQALLPRMIEEARRAGVPPGVLELHTGSSSE